jgi:hypothetical protein
MQAVVAAEHLAVVLLEPAAQESVAQVVLEFLLVLEALALLVLQIPEEAEVVVVPNHLLLIDKAVVEQAAQVSSSSRSINKRSNGKHEGLQVPRH